MQPVHEPHLYPGLVELLIGMRVLHMQRQSCPALHVAAGCAAANASRLGTLQPPCTGTHMHPCGQCGLLLLSLTSMAAQAMHAEPPAAGRRPAAASCQPRRPSQQPFG